MPKITDNWNHARGDMLYGLGPQITEYIEHIFAFPSPDWDRAHRFKEERYVAINTYNTVIKDKLFRITGGSISTNKPSTANSNKQFYIDEIAKHKFGPTHVAGDIATDDRLRSSLQKGNNTLSARSTDRAIRAAAKELAIRRSCKFGIEFAAGSGGSKAIIHYILDGMESTMKKVAQKELFDKEINLKGGNKLAFKKIPICTSELRFIFRNWQRFGHTGNVKFYHKLEWVLPPWEDEFWQSLDEWAEYAAHRVDKSYKKALESARSKLATPSNGMGDIYLQSHVRKPYEAFLHARALGHAPKEQIKRFHEIPCNLVNL